MANEDFIVRFYFDVREAERDAAKFANKLAIISTALKEMGYSTKEIDRAAKAMANFSGAANNASDNGKKLNQSLSTTRYALYDVSNTLGIAGAAMVAFTSATFGIAIAYEKEFTNVIRTSQATGNQIAILRDNFIELAQTIPIAFGELTKIGTIGSQLGIAKDNLASFVNSVAQFSTATGIDVETTAMAFGRLNELLPDVQGNFNLLGSMIAKTGVESVATEAQIVKISQQIASMGNLAGLSSDEVIALASAFASLGIAPELARSVVTSSFTKIINAVAQGTDKVDAFGKVLGLSGKQFQEAWREDAIGTFRDLLGTIASQGENGVTTLQDLGLASQRLTPTLLKLGQNTEILNAALADTAGQIDNPDELLRQFAITSETVAAKLQLVANNFGNLLYSIGQGGGFFGGLLDILNDILVSLTELAQNPIANFFLQTGVIITGFVGILALLGAVALRGYAGLIAISQGLSAVGGSAGVAGVSLSTVTAQLAATGPLGFAASKGIGALGVAMKALPIAALTALSFEMFKVLDRGINDLVLGIGGIDQTAIPTFNRLKSAYGDIFAGDSSQQASIAFQRSLANIGIETSLMIKDLKVADEAIESLFKGGNAAAAVKQLETLANASGTTVENVLKYLPGASAQYTLYSDNIASTAKATKGLVDAETEAAVATDILASKIGVDSTEALKSLGEALAKGSSAFLGFGGILDSIQQKNKDWATAQAEATDSSTDSWKDFYDGTSVSLADFSNALQGQLDAQAAWADDLRILAARGATGFVTEIAKLGPEGASLAAEAVNLTADELAKLEERSRLAAFLSSQAFADAFINNTPALIEAYRTGGVEAVQALIAQQVADGPAAVGRIVSNYNSLLLNNPLRIQADTSPADRAVSQFLGRTASASATVTVYTRNVQGRAGGGYIRGPGTGTSDSIPARLSHGEYVIRAASVRKYGSGIFDQLNRGVAKFANGGPVASRVPSSVQTQWSPADRALARGMAGGSKVIQLVVDGKVLATAVDEANQNEQFTGSR